MKEQSFARGEKVAGIFKLVDACSRCGLTFRLASERVSSTLFRYFADELRQILDRYSFELLAEVRRIDDGDFGPPRTYVEEAVDAAALRDRCEALLHDLVWEYEEILRNHLPAHARAMVKRQSQVLHEMCGRYDGLYRELSA